MARRNRVFRGLSRPAEWGGLPVIHLMVVVGMALAALSFLGLTPAVVLGFTLYTGLRLFYDWEPEFFRLLFVTLARTPRGKTRRHHGGDFYSA